MKTAIIVPAYKEPMLGWRIDQVAAHEVGDVYILDGGGNGAFDTSLVSGVLECPTGLGNAIKVALTSSIVESYDAIVRIDGDGQQSVESVAVLARQVGAGTDFVIGSRFLSTSLVDGDVPIDRAVLNIWARSLVNSLCGTGFSDVITGAWGLSSRAARYLGAELREKQYGITMEAIMLIRLRTEFVTGEVPLRVAYKGWALDRKYLAANMEVRSGRAADYLTVLTRLVERLKLGPEVRALLGADSVR